MLDLKATGGQDADVQWLVSGLVKEGYTVETFRSLQPLDLLRFDIVYLSDMHNPGNVDDGWRRTDGSAGDHSGRYVVGTGRRIEQARELLDQAPPATDARLQLVGHLVAEVP